MENLINNTLPLVRVKNKFQITIPTKIRKDIRIKEGDVLEMGVRNNTIVIKPKVILDRSIVENSIQEGLRDYKKGKTIGPFSSVKEFKKVLRK